MVSRQDLQSILYNPTFALFFSFHNLFNSSLQIVYIDRVLKPKCGGVDVELLVEELHNISLPDRT